MWLHSLAYPHLNVSLFSPFVQHSSSRFTADVPTYQQFHPATPTLSITPTPPTDPPPAPPPLNVPPSRARRQLAARLALHSQQKADAEAEADDAAATTNSSSAAHDPHSSQIAATDHLASELGVNDLHDPLNQGDDEDGEEVPLAGPTPEVNFEESSPPMHPHEGMNDIDAADGSEGIEGKAKHLTSSPGHIRHLDLDDFANSPAADVDDGNFGEGDDRGKVAEGSTETVGVV